MSLARFMKMVGVLALVTGVITFTLPGEFIYFPQLEELLTTFGEALFAGISQNPVQQLFIAKAPALLLMFVGFVLLFMGFVRDLDTATRKAEKKIMDEEIIRQLVEAEKAKKR